MPPVECINRGTRRVSFILTLPIRQSTPADALTTTDFQAYSTSLNPSVNSFFLFQMVALNFGCILMMLKDGGTIPQYTLCSQDGINLGDIHFCPMMHLDSCSCPHGKRGHDLLRLPESHAGHTPPAPADPHGCLIRDKDTAHYCSLPGVFGLQKMAP